MSPDTERLIRHVVLDRGFEVRLEQFGGAVVCTVTDPSDPRGRGCSWLRGESGNGETVEQALVSACTAARDDVYPQATGCGRAVKQLDATKAGPPGWSHCVLGKVHDGDCKDAEGNTRPD